MSLAIRKATAADTDALFRVCLLTADAGKSAEGLHDFPELPGLIFAVPYLTRKATFAYVLEDEDTKEVVGYVVGSPDTREYEQDVHENWFLVHAVRYLYGSPLDKPDTKKGDRSYLDRLYNPNAYQAREENIAFSPAHLHINILEKYQRKGWGKRLIGKAIECLKEKGVDGVWVGLDPRNEEAKRFYEKIGFRDIEGVQDDNQLGLKFVDFH